MSSMNRKSMVTLCVGTVIAALVVVNTASAQLLPPGASQFSPPPLPPLPPPKIEVPVVPQMDARRRSRRFSRRVAAPSATGSIAVWTKPRRRGLGSVSALHIHEAALIGRRSFLWVTVCV
jgi:hypothetical protein